MRLRGIEFRWLVGLSMDVPVWSATTFSKNRERLVTGDIAQAFFTAVKAQASAAGLLSTEHFTVDGTLLEAYASLKSFQPKDAPSPPSDNDPGNPSVDFHGQTRPNQTHQSTTDPDSRLFRKSNGQPARLAPGRCSQRTVRAWSSTRPRRRPAISRKWRTPWRWSNVWAPDAEPWARTRRSIKWGFVRGVRAVGKTPHVVARVAPSVLDGRTTGQPGYALSPRRRKGASRWAASDRRSPISSICRSPT